MGHRTESYLASKRLAGQINKQLAETHPNVGVNLTGHHTGPYVLTIDALNQQEMLRLLSVVKEVIGGE